MRVKDYQLRGGLHPETATLSNALAHAGMVAPNSEEPFTEQMLFGIGGGLGAGYILWEFKAQDAKILVMGFRNQWQYPVQYLQKLCDRIGVKMRVLETGGKKKAEANLQGALENGQVAVCWVDQAHMPYLMIPPEFDGCFGYVVNAFGIDEESDQVLVDDRGNQPFRVSTAEFAAARGRIGSYKNRIVLVEPEGEVDLPKAMREGIHDCVENLGGKSESFALPTYKKWARMMTDEKNKKGWPTVFADHTGLYMTLQSIYEGTKPIGPGGGSLRGLYASFLEEASEALDNPALKEASERYRALEGQWIGFGDAALPEETPEFERARELVDRKMALLMTQGSQAFEEVRGLSEELRTLQKELNLNFPLKEAGVAALFADLQGRMEAIYEAEVEALESLRQAVA